MKKIRFDIKYRDNIGSGAYKLRTVEGDPVNILCWCADDSEWPMVGLVIPLDGGSTVAVKYSLSGECQNAWDRSKYNILIETDEEELTVFENRLMDMLGQFDGDYAVFADIGYCEKLVHAWSGELKELAYKEVCENADRHEFPGKQIYDAGFEVGRSLTDGERKKIFQEGRDDALKELHAWASEKYNESEREKDPDMRAFREMKKMIISLCKNECKDE